VRIAILCHMHHPIAEPFQGGTEAHTAILANELVARGHEVTLFAKEGSETAATLYPLVPREFEFTRVASALVREQQHGFLAEAGMHSIEVIAASGFDVVINNSLSSLPYRFMRHVPMLTILHTPPTLADVTSIVTSAGWTPSPLHRYVTVSETNARDWQRLLPSVHTVYNGIHLDRWSSDAVARPGVAVWAARITPEKGLDLAIDAARLAGMELEIAGPISHSDYFDTEVVPRLGSDVRYRGHLAHHELADFYASGSVFVASPRWSEPFGLSVVEALATGTPVAALPNGASSEIVTHDAGSVAHAISSSALARAITRASAVDRDDARFSATRFSVSTMVDRYEEYLVELAPVGARPEQELAS